MANEQRVLLLNELDTAEAEEREELQRQKRLQQKLKKKKKKKERTETSNEEEESSADWMIEYDIPPLETTTLTDEDRTERVNLILAKIKKQQEELRKLRQYVLSMLGEQPKRTATTTTTANTTQPSNSLSPELLLALFNQSNQNGCWLCSGKLYSEVATQCDEPTTQ